MARQFDNIVKRGNRWFVRIMIPRALRPLYGRREFIRALGTSNVSEARLKGFNFLAAVLREFQQVRATGALPGILVADTILELGTAQQAVGIVGAHHQPLYSAMLLQEMPQAIRGIPTIMEAFELYAEDNPRKVADDTLSQNRYVVRLLSEFLGKDPLVTLITKNAIREWRRALAEWPIKAKEVKELKGLPFPEVLITASQIWGARARVTISQKTINRYLSAVGGFCSWLVTATDYLESNPVDGFYLKLDKTVQKVFPFDPNQLRAFFCTPVFTGCVSSEIDHLPGQFQIRDYRFWLPLIALYSGARLGELAQLLTADIKRMGERWVLHITREGSSKKRTKTLGSQRVIPIHPKLIELGLLEYHQRQLAHGESRLFPEIEEDKRGQISGRPSRWFGRYMKRNGLREASRFNFHSFRHTATDALRRAGFSDEQIGPVLGHTRGTMTARYGTEPVGTIQQRADMIDAISYDLDLSHLLPSATAKAA